MAKNVLTHVISEPLDGAAAVKVDIDPRDGNLAVDGLIGSAQLLVSGSLQYLERQGPPAVSVNTSDGQTTLTLKTGGGGQTWLRLPWQVCNGATEWQIHLNPTLPSDITANSGGGNVKLNLAGMRLNRVSAATGGGNMDLVLPDNTADLSAIVKTGAGNVTVEIGDAITGSSVINAMSGAGNVTVRVPGSVAVSIYVISGTPKMDPRFVQVDRNTYKSPDFDSAIAKIELTLKSGMGNVSVNVK